MRLSTIFSRSCLAAAGLSLSLLAAAAPAFAGDGPGGYREVFYPDGHPRLVKAGRDHPAPVDHLRAARVTTIQKTGADRNRFVLVVLGDGYTKSQQGTYAGHAERLMNTLFTVSPYKQYKKLFNIYRVDVASSQSGVSGAAGRNSTKRTALGSHFYCDGVERLLCANEKAAGQYAAKASNDVDAIAVVANTKKYGGSGGPLTTVAGGNAGAGQILPHEMGHTTGKLGDTYGYPYGTAKGGPNPPYRNVSTHAKTAMRKRKADWYRWLNTKSPSGGRISTYQGANYYKKGYYRPSKDSLMRTLGKRFDSVGREAMIIGFWRNVHPIDAHTANAGARKRSGTLSVKRAPVKLSTQWWVDKKHVKGSNGKRAMKIGSLRLSKGRKHWISVTVKDKTGWVRDSGARSKYMAQRVTWTVSR